MSPRGLRGIAAREGTSSAPDGPRSPAGAAPRTRAPRRSRRAGSRPRAPSSRRRRTRRSVLTSTPVSVTKPSRGSESRSSSSARPSSTTSLTPIRTLGLARPGDPCSAAVTQAGPTPRSRSSIHVVSTSSSSTSGAASTKRSTESRISRRCPSLSATTATPIAARCHRSWWSTSATETWNRCRSPSTMGRIAARFAFSERLSGMWRSKQTAAACTPPSSRQLPRGSVRPIGPGAQRGSRTTTGILRSVFSWYAA